MKYRNRKTAPTHLMHVTTPWPHRLLRVWLSGLKLVLFCLWLLLSILKFVRVFSWLVWPCVIFWPIWPCVILWPVRPWVIFWPVRPLVIFWPGRLCVIIWPVLPWVIFCPGRPCWTRACSTSCALAVRIVDTSSITSLAIPGPVSYAWSRPEGQHPTPANQRVTTTTF